jgi:hypothetical protein
MVYRNVSNDLKHAAVRMSRALPIKTVALLLNISEETVCRAINLYIETGDVIPLSTGLKRGRKRILSESDAQVGLHSEESSITDESIHSSILKVSWNSKSTTIWMNIGHD